MYHYTESTWLQFFYGRLAHRFRSTSLQASSLCILYCGYIQYIIFIVVDVSVHAVACSLAKIHIRHSTCTHCACLSLEEVVSMPEQFDLRSQSLSLSICEN